MANPVEDLMACDDDNDGYYLFDFEIQTEDVLNGQDSNLFSVSYHNQLVSAIEGIDNIEGLYNALNTETIYIRITNNITGCYALTAFQTHIYDSPEVSIGDQVLCLDDLPLIISAETNTVDDTYLWSTNATSSEIEIYEPGSYFVVITSPEGCETIEEFTVFESESATIEITENIDFFRS